MILALIHNLHSSEHLRKMAENLAEKFNKKWDFIHFEDIDLQDLQVICEEREVSFLALQTLDNKAKNVQVLLNACRNLRIPYLIWKNDFLANNFKKILVPVSFLEEEIEKAQFASAFGRFFGSEITILQANDYGTKAAKTVAKMQTFFDKFSLQYSTIKAKSNSFKLEKEAKKMVKNEHFELVLLSASREYGLDDIIFGTKERHAIQKTLAPVLLINPRGDLYALCD